MNSELLRTITDKRVAGILASRFNSLAELSSASFDPQPPNADIRVTRDLIRPGQLLRTNVQVHVILGKLSEHREKDFVSLREMGYFM